METFDQPKLVEIKCGRWDVDILVVDKFENSHKFKATADAAFTDHSGIWYGTYDEFINELNGH